MLRSFVGPWFYGRTLEPASESWALSQSSPACRSVESPRAWGRGLWKPLSLCPHFQVSISCSHPRHHHKGDDAANKGLPHPLSLLPTEPHRMSPRRASSSALPPRGDQCCPRSLKSHRTHAHTHTPLHSHTPLQTLQMHSHFSRTHSSR